MDVRTAMVKFKPKSAPVSHIAPVPRNRWVDTLAEDTLTNDSPWNQPDTIWEVFTHSSIFFNNREYTEWFVVVENDSMWLCHYNEEDAITTIVTPLDTI